MTCFCENPELISHSSSNTKKNPKKSQVSLLRELFNQTRDIGKAWVGLLWVPLSHQLSPALTWMELSQAGGARAPSRSPAGGEQGSSARLGSHEDP